MSLSSSSDLFTTCYSSQTIDPVISLLSTLSSAASYTTDSDGRTPLHHACAGGKYETAKYLLSLSPNVTPCTVDASLMTPLTSAASAGAPVELIQLLLDRGADANAQDEQGCIPLHRHKGRVHIVRALGSATRDINAKDKTGVTPLHRAAGGGHVEALRSLLVLKADPLVVDCEGNTPLHFAAEELRVNCVVELIAAAGCAAAGTENVHKKIPADLAKGDSEDARRVRTLLNEAVLKAKKELEQ